MDESKRCNFCKIIYCYGQNYIFHDDMTWNPKCGIQHMNGYGVHCVSCFGDKHENVPTSEPDLNNIKIFSCNGDMCKIHYLDKLGLHCESCYGKFHMEEYENF